MHPRNRHRGRYDFKLLCQTHPGLTPHVRRHPVDGETIDFSDKDAVKALNTALLKRYYALDFWELPDPYLCPAIPGRADYVHHMADLVKARGPTVRMLDVGVGANCVYPLIAHREYGWSVVGSDVDGRALMLADRIVQENALAGAIELRLQRQPRQMFKGIVRPAETFDLTVCNPPFYASQEEARAESGRKWRHLGLSRDKDERNFQGQGRELWCPGGEASFLKDMVYESREFKDQVKWFSSLVSKSGNLKELDRRLEKIGAAEMHTIDMEQGQKKSRIVAWTF